MRKRLLSIVLSVVVIMATPLTASADAVWGNDFFDRNKDRTEPIGEGNNRSKRFCVNSPAGFVVPKLEPGSDKVINSYRSIQYGGGTVHLLINGDIVSIVATYLHNGEYWGVLDFSHDYTRPGWIKMDELLLLYEKYDFEEENKDAFYEYTGSYRTVINAKRVVLWTWPGSDREKTVYGESWGRADYDPSRFADVDYAYRDRNGRVWGKTTWTRDWVCLSDPENSDIPAFNPAPPSKKWTPDGTFDWSVAVPVTVWPPTSYSKLFVGNKPADASMWRHFVNVFFQQHEEDMIKQERTRFLVNEPDGTSVVRAEPVLTGEVLTHWYCGPLKYPNGTEVFIDYACFHNGEYWGLVANAPPIAPTNYPPGWVPMENLLAIFTNADFIDTHRDKLYRHSGELMVILRGAAEKLDDFTYIILWEWPGSEVEKNLVKIHTSRFSAVANALVKNNTSDIAYIDEAGREWPP